MRTNSNVMIVSHLSTSDLSILLSSPHQSTRLVFTILQLCAACLQSQSKKIENCHISGKVMGDNNLLKEIHFVNVNFSCAEALGKLSFEHCYFERCLFKNRDIVAASKECDFLNNTFEENFDEHSFSSISSGFFERRRFAVSETIDLDSQLNENEIFNNSAEMEFNLPSFVSLGS